MDYQDFQNMVANEERQAEQAVRDFVEGAATGDLERMVDSFDAPEYGELHGGGWVGAMRAVTRLGSVPRETQDWFLQVFIKHGDHIRQECDDLVLADGLRVLLPRYECPAMRLYRGESFDNHSLRTYGFSWTATLAVGQDYADTGFCRMSNGGSVLLETLAPPAAIICAPALLDDRYAEEEYVVDCRRLTSVIVIERFTQLSLDQFRNHRASRVPGRTT